MEDDFRSPRISSLRVIIATLVGILIGYLLGEKQVIEKIIHNETEEVRDTTYSEDSVSTPKSVDTTKTKAIDTTKTNTPEPVPQQIPLDSNAITVASYSHDWLDDEAHVSFRNNTDQPIRSFEGRMTYYDMAGNMLDYKDFKVSKTIDCHMTKSIEIEGYNHDQYFVYYKNKPCYGYENNRYKIKFELKSVQYAK